MPTSPAAGKTHVLVFVMADCPISNRYAPELDRLATTYAAKQVSTLLVYEDPAIDAAKVKAHLASFYPTRPLPAIVDTDHSIAKAAGATITPTAAIFTPAGRAYRGRIDDLYISIGRQRREPTEATLRLALDNVLAGRPVAAPETQAIGCYIGG